MAIYKVESVQTNYVIISTGNEKDGDDVLSLPSIPCIPADSDLTFSAPISGPVTFVNVKGKAGLYISADTATGRLVWSKEVYGWQVASTSKGTYEFYPHNGANLYWYQNQQILDTVGVKGGSLLRENEPFFLLLA